MKQSYLKYMLDRDNHYRKAFILAAAVPIACAAAAVIVWYARDFFLFFFMPCSIRQLTGFHCVSCGATRATYALLSGHPAEAVYYNPLYVVFLCWLMYLYFRLIISLIIRPYHRFSLNLNRTFAAIVIGIIILFTIVRNLPFYQSIFY